MLVIAAAVATSMMMASPVMADDFKVGICNYVDDASLNQIVDNIQFRLEELGKEKGVTFDVSYDNCNADASVMEQIISDFQADKVDLMVGVATPVAMRMQSATEGSDTPVVFSAVSDPVGSGLVDSLDAPGANITGTSDYLDTSSIMKLIQAQNPDVKKIGLLYDVGQDSSTTAIQEAKDYLDKEGIEYVERTGTTTDEVQLAADALIADGVDAVFTPTDNTIMTAELSIYEKFIDALHGLFGKDNGARKVAVLYLAKLGVGWCLGLSGWTVGLCGLFFVMLNWFFGAFGLTLGVLRPNLQWTSEAMVIKQGLNSFIVVMLAFLIPLAVAFGGFLTVDILGTEGYFAAVAVLFGVLSFAMTRWLDTRGARRFEQL